MGDLRNNFYKSTGLTYDIENFLENLPEDQKIKMFKKIKWQMNSGILMDNVKSEKTENGVNTIIKLAQKLNMSGDDLDLDGKISDDEIKINKIISSAKEKQIEITEYKKEQELSSLRTILSEEDLFNACNVGGEYKLMSNIDLIEMMQVKSNLILHLNGFNISKSTNTESGKCIIFYITGNGSSLTINGKGKIEALGGLNGGTGANVIIWTCDGTEAILNDGYYHSSPKNGSDLIYNQGGKIFINGGEFLIDTIDENSFLKPQFAICNIYDSKRQAESFVIKGGKFHNFNPMNNLSEGQNTNFVAKGYTTNNSECYDIIMGEVIYEVTKELINSEEKLLLAIETLSEIILDSDIILSNYVEIRDKEITINLNGYSITHPSSSSASYKDVFETYGNAKLTIEGDGKIIAEDGYCVYAAGDSSVILNGGKYFSPVSTIDARKNAIVTINGGEYKVDGSNNVEGDFGQKYTLNLRDKKGNYTNELANFIVKGGKFFKFDPSKSEAEPTIVNFVEDGYKVIKNGDWFEVIK